MKDFGKVVYNLKIHGRYEAPGFNLQHWKNKKLNE
jgi:hypothetical protein